MDHDSRLQHRCQRHDRFQFQVDTTANNLANLNTTGFKRNEVAFQDLLYLNLLQPGTEQFQGVPLPTWPSGRQRRARCHTQGC